MNDGLSTSMFWVGAMFAFTPVIMTGIALAVWWNWRRRKKDGLLGIVGEDLTR